MRCRHHRWLGSWIAFSVALLASPAAWGTPLLTNGGFEDGYASWTESGIVYFGLAGLQQLTPGWGEWQTDYSNSGAPWYWPGVPPPGGTELATYYPDGPILGILYQEFSVPVGASVHVSFDFYTDAGPATDWPCGFDIECTEQLPAGTYNPDDLFRVDIVRADADPFSTAPGEHLALLDGSDDFSFPPIPDPFLHADFDVSDFVVGGGSFWLRFAGYGAQRAHVDNASVELVPEPGTGLLMALGLVVAAIRRRARP